MARLDNNNNTERQASACRCSPADLRRLLDRATWGEPLSYGDLLTQPTVQTRIARCIVRATAAPPYRRRRRRRRTD